MNKKRGYRLYREARLPEEPRKAEGGRLGRSELCRPRQREGPAQVHRPLLDEYRALTQPSGRCYGEPLARQTERGPMVLFVMARQGNSRSRVKKS